MAEKKKVILLGSEGCGRGNDDLGYQILTVFLEAIADREDKPEAIILWNTAVKILVKGSPLVTRLKKLEEKGVKILAGRLCLAELEIEDKLAVGKAASMGDILDLVLHKEVISL